MTKPPTSASMSEATPKLRELPRDIAIPPRPVLTPSAFKQVTDLVEKPRKPTKALRDLIAGKSIEWEP